MTLQIKSCELLLFHEIFLPADKIYKTMGETLGTYGKSFQRQCEANSKKTCACQVIYIFFQLFFLAYFLIFQLAN